MIQNSSLFKCTILACFLLNMLVITACGTLEFSLEEPTAIAELPITPTTLNETPELTSASTANLLENEGDGKINQAVGWYGTIHSVSSADPNYDYLKLWHLDLWPKFGRAVGIAGTDPAVEAEIARIRDMDIKAAFWGTFNCGVGDYGDCQLRVSRISANDGGPNHPPEQIESWDGIVGRLPVQPGSQNNRLYFVLAGEVPVLYGISSSDPAIQEELERLPEAGSTVRIWGELSSNVQPVIGTLIDVTRLEYVEDISPP